MEDADGSFLLWIPIGIAGYLYNKFDESGHGGLAAILGGGISLFLVLTFPVQSTLAALVALGLWLLLSYFKKR
ncbi:hypothetical protein D7S43_00010 [Alcaligenes faecalis]|nr:hypothetical protein D7S43_00010 [Alcaligenes faecalis]